MQMPILSGVYADVVSDFRTAYPINLVPVPKDIGLSKGYLRTADGIEQFAELEGVDRGGIVWNGLLYRVYGTSLVSVSSEGITDILGDVGTGGRCSFDYSFDRLSVSSGGRFYYWNGEALQRVVDVDIGTVLDHLWIDGYFATTDGKYIIVTELTDPLSVNPLKYGSSEYDPDPIVGLLKIRGELIVLNRYSCETFNNIGGELFPFQRVDGAMITKGAVGTQAKAKYMQSYAFVGGGRNEPVSVYIGGSGTAEKIATREIEIIINQYSEEQLADTIVESQEFETHQRLYIHLPNETLVFDAAVSAATQESIWYILKSGALHELPYCARNFVFAYGKWIVGDTTRAVLGVMTDKTTAQYGDTVGWEFSTTLLYNEGRGAIIKSMELVGTFGRAELGVNPSVFCSYTKDGLTWSQERIRSAGLRGDYLHRMTWHRFGVRFGNWLGVKFRGSGTTTLAIPRLDIDVEALNV